MNNPAPFCKDIRNVKAIVLGADPSNSSDQGQTVNLKYVFGIESGDNRYFQQILKNLNAIGLTINDIYAQNLIQEDLGVETGKNKTWEVKANEWLPILQKELETFDKLGKIPVLVTAERIMKFLSKKSVPEAGKIYSAKEPGIVDKANSRLERELIPFYRHYQYSFDKKQNANYFERLKGIFKA